MTDPNFREVVAMDASAKDQARQSAVETQYVIREMPIFSRPSGPCAAGYVPIIRGGRHGCPEVITLL